MEPSQSLRECNAYEGSEVANRFVMIEPLWNWRTVTVTERRTGRDVAGWVCLFVDEYYSESERIVLIIDHVDIRIYS
jgi:hypothetical protein